GFAASRAAPKPRCWLPTSGRCARSERSGSRSSARARRRWPPRSSDAADGYSAGGAGRAEPRQPEVFLDRPQQGVVVERLVDPCPPGGSGTHRDQRYASTGATVETSSVGLASLVPDYEE